MTVSIRRRDFKTVIQDELFLSRSDFQKIEQSLRHFRKTLVRIGDRKNTKVMITNVAEIGLVTKTIKLPLDSRRACRMLSSNKGPRMKAKTSGVAG